MFRAMSTRKIHGGYEKLVEEEQVLKKGTSVPASVYGNSRNPVQDVKKTPEKPMDDSVHPLLSLFNVRFHRKKKSLATAKPTGGSVHPLLSLFSIRSERRKKKKTRTKKKSLARAKPEFARYMEYVKEGGVWDLNSNAPVIHYR